jgi:hypothetical protein
VRSREDIDTQVLPEHHIHPAQWLNHARHKTRGARQDALDVGTPGARAAAALLAAALLLLDAETATISRRLSEKEKTPMFKYAVAFLCFLFPVAAIAQAASLPVDLSTQDALGQLLSSLGGVKGASALGIIAVVLQAIMLFFRTPLANFAGKWRFLIVAGTSLVAGTVALIATGTPVLAALAHANTLAATQVFFHQLVTQFQKPA